MLDSATSSIRQQLVGRVRRDVPYHGYFVTAIESAFNLVDRFDEERSRISADKRFSDSGKRDAIAELVNDKFAPELARGTAKTARHASERLASRRTAVGRPEFDKSDLTAALERREVRDFVRSQPEGKRMVVVLELLKDKRMAEAVLSGPGVALTGLTPEQHRKALDFYLREHFREQIAASDNERNDIEAVTAASDIARQKLFAASQKSDAEWAKRWSELEQQADRS